MNEAFQLVVQKSLYNHHRHQHSKMLKITILIILSILIVSINTKSLSWGNIRNNNLLLFDQLFFGRGDLRTELAPKVFFFSTKGTVISAIHVNDLTDNQGGDALILQGGAGFTFVRMKLYPHKNRLLLNVQIFGEHDRIYEYEFYE
ncbi:hypothetical protein PVAND_010125 [Polypedilum vanderplanki]|uniref:Uncharacterized protein n=1 Tax=Polypedilum vanderplanki TaxID=319348 RepID=A0A9J6CFE3_POLVA|nr:hypothetical protein PVAND_010125 [Polypedilum vanderplanki]